MRGVGTANAGLHLIIEKKKPKYEFTFEEAQKISNAIVMQINILAGQLFELHSNFNKVILLPNDGTLRRNATNFSC